MAEPRKKPAPSRKNRDQERLYKPGKLSVWMAIWSVLLLISWLLILKKDHDRPWKQYQRDFWAQVIRLEEGENEEILAAQDAKAIQDKIQALQEKRTRTQKTMEEAKVFEQVAADRERLEEMEKDLGALDARFKGIKGDYAVAKYLFEMARLEAKDQEAKPLPQVNPEAVEAKRAVVNALAEDWQEAKNNYESMLVEVQNLQAGIAQALEPLRQIDKELAEVSSPQTKQAAKLDGLRAKYKNNQWRNAPFVDFISPTIKIQQVVLDDIHDNWNFATNVKVDRCITCHLGASMPAMGTAEVLADPAVEPWMRAHPHLDVIAGPKAYHKVDKFGCTTCHAGVGWATDFARAAHTPASEAEKARWQDAHDWYKAKYIDYPMLPLPYVQGQCVKCHKAGMFEPVVYDERLDHGYIADHYDVQNARAGGEPKPTDIFAQRANINDPLQPGFLDALANPVLPPGQAHGAFKLPRAPNPVDGTNVDVRNQTLAWMATHVEKALGPVPGRKIKGTDREIGRMDDRTGMFAADVVDGASWTPERYWKGYDTIVRYGCQGCHKIEDFGDQVGYAKPPKVGPDLTYIADKVRDADWVARWIKHPDAFRPATKMPSFYYFAEKDHNFDYLRSSAEEGKQGDLRLWHVMDAHMTDPNPIQEANLAHVLGPLSTPADHARANVEILAMTTFLMNQKNPETGERWSRANPQDPAFQAYAREKRENPYTVDIPAGDLENGRLLVNNKGCMACHILPEIETQPGVYGPDSMARFDFDPLLMRGPRLMGMPSKVTRQWLNAWLEDPRHYTPHTTMGDMRIDDLVDPVTKEVKRSGLQRRADIIDYLLQEKFQNKEFDALEAPTYKAAYDPLVEDMWQEFFSKTPAGLQRDPAAVSGEFAGLNPATRLARIGERLMSRKGCFGCHNLAGHEDEQPIGTELTKEGIKDIHQLDYGRLPKYVKIDGEKVPVYAHSRHNFIRTKITYPRIFDYSKDLRWVDKLRMPRFNFRMDDAMQRAKPGIPASIFNAENPRHLVTDSTRAAVAGMVLGFVKEPIKPGAIYTPDSYEQDIIAGRRVIKRYACNNCHTIEGKQGYLWGLLRSGNHGPKPDFFKLPPNLFTQGWRVRDEWLMGFLQEPFMLRPAVQEQGIHMPRFGLNAEETLALVRYFKRLGGRDRDMGAYNQASVLARIGEYESPVDLVCKKEGHDLGTARNAVEEARRLFDRHNCNKCHLPKGWPGMPPADGGVSPSFDHAGERLRWPWVRMLLNDPAHLIHETAMPSFYGVDRKGNRQCELEFQAFQFHLRWDEDWLARYNSTDKAVKAEAEAELARLQMDALTDYVIHHYEPPAPFDPPSPGAGR